MDNRNLVRDSIKYALPSLPLMYLNFFIDAGARSYSPDLTGRFFNAILENQYAAARGLLGGMIAMVLVCTVFLPLWAMLTNALYFSLSLKYDLRVTSAFYSKRYERMRAFETGEVAERIFRDPDDLLTLIAVTPTHLLAQKAGRNGRGEKDTGQSDRRQGAGNDPSRRVFPLLRRGKDAAAGAAGGL